MKKIKLEVGQKILYRGEVVEVRDINTRTYYTLCKDYQGGGSWMSQVDSSFLGVEDIVVIPKNATKAQIKAITSLTKRSK